MSETDATEKKGVSISPTSLDARESIVADVESARREELRAEGVDVEEPVDVLEDDDLSAEDDNLQLQEDDLEKEQISGDQTKSTEDVVIKVDKEDVIVPVKDQEDFRQKLQKGYAAEKRFDEASQIKRENEQKERELAEREAALLAQENIAKESTELTAEAEEEIETLFEELTDAVLTEDHAKGKEVLKKLRPKSTAPGTPVTTEQITQAATVAVTKAEYDKELKAAQVTFSEEFPELDGSPMLRENVNQTAKRIFQQDMDAPPLEILRKAGQSVREEIATAAGSETLTAEEIKLNKKRRVATRPGQRRPAALAGVRRPAGRPKVAPSEADHKTLTSVIVAERNAGLS